MPNSGNFDSVVWKSFPEKSSNIFKKYEKITSLENKERLGDNKLVLEKILNQYNQTKNEQPNEIF